MKPTTNKPLSCDDLWNERQAHLSIQQSKAQVIQDGIAARNAQARFDEQLRKQRKNEALMHRAKQLLMLIAIAIVAYTLIYFTG